MSGGMLPIGAAPARPAASSERSVDVAREPRGVGGTSFLALLARIVTGKAGGERRIQDDAVSTDDASVDGSAARVSTGENDTVTDEKNGIEPLVQDAVGVIQEIAGQSPVPANSAPTMALATGPVAADRLAQTDPEGGTDAVGAKRTFGAGSEEPGAPTAGAAGLGAGGAVPASDTGPVSATTGSANVGLSSADSALAPVTDGHPGLGAPRNPADAGASGNALTAQSPAASVPNGVSASNQGYSASPSAADSASTAAQPSNPAAAVTGPTDGASASNPSGVAPSRAAGIDPLHVENGLDQLDPDFRVRLERVIARMEREYGHRVSIVETYRHQDRQDHLYAQGRTRPGNIVTWTRSSNHTQGIAADVIVDDSYGNPTAYARLQQIAAQEGLRGLGARDPGHLELTTSEDATTAPAGPLLAAGDADARVTARARTAPRARVIAAGEPARPAAVAAVARVATPAVARVAAVAVPGARPSSSAAAAPGSGESDSAPAPTAPATPGANPLDAGTDPAAYLAALDGPRLDDAPVTPVARTLTSASAERIAHLLDLESSTPIKPLNQVLLRLEGAAGEDRIRLDLRGNAVGATIDAGDPATAERLGTRLGELQRALERQGLEAETLQVRTQLRSDAGALGRPSSAAELDPLRAAGQKATGEPGSRERHQPEPRDEARQESANRNRSRREHRGGQNA